MTSSQHDMRPLSIRRLLITSSVAITVLVWSTAAYFSYRDAKIEIQELFDAQLADAARTLLSQVQLNLIPSTIHQTRNDEHENDEGKQEDSDTDSEEEAEHFVHRYGQSLLYQIWKSGMRTNDQTKTDDQLIFQSTHGLKIDRLAVEPEGEHSNRSSYYSSRLVDGQTFRIFSLWDDSHQFQIQVAQKQERRETFSNHVAFHIIVPILVAIPILALLISLVINHALIPLRKTAKDVSSLDPNHLDPISVDQCPTEIVPLIHAINALFRRLNDELEKERRFTADASHELRTPLAAIKVQAEVALTSTSELERKNALEKLNTAVDRTTHLVTQLLTLARLDPGSTLVDCESVDLNLIAKEVISELTPFALKKKIDLGLQSFQSNALEDKESNEATTLKGNRYMLSMMLRNLIDNAIRYTPEEGKVNVTIQPTSTGQMIQVQDSGPGISIENQNRIFDRFYRIYGTDQDGSGLGLSIVKKIVELHRGQIQIEGPPGFIIRILLHSANV